MARPTIFLSILPPSDALALAEKMAALIGQSNHKPIYVDCNAVSPPTKVEIGNVITKAGSPFVDVGIIGAAAEARLRRAGDVSCRAPSRRSSCRSPISGSIVRVMKVRSARPRR